MVNDIWMASLSDLLEHFEMFEQEKAIRTGIWGILPVLY